MCLYSNYHIYEGMLTYVHSGFPESSGKWPRKGQHVSAPCYHLAEKKIPSIHGYTMGLKLEQFVFDAFTYAPSMALFEVSFR
ncbi:hypothetical protein BHE74_00018050 [Ensete ventricosum]|nr:hypothetical protein GW17_00027126 [Ensete ventricosum]RWW74024.1 hypothetical protein BHE74_00018050 [Ensete ventricosum]RZR95261.1 hypothetical protein BHM03_00024066 [Ensete ventricosum]